MQITIYIDGLRILWEKSRASCPNNKTVWLQLLQYKAPQKSLGTNPLAKVHPLLECKNTHLYRPDTVAIQEIRCYEKPSELLSLRLCFQGEKITLGFKQIYTSGACLLKFGGS